MDRFEQLDDITTMDIMKNMRRLHIDRPAIAAKVDRAFEFLWEERHHSNVPKKNILEALLIIVEYSGDYYCQSSALKMLLAKDDVIEYKEWLAQSWFKDLPNTLKAFIDLKPTDNEEDICNFLFLYNTELELQFLYSVRCFLLTWSNTPIPRKGAIWLHLNCGTKTLSITGVDEIPSEFEDRKVFVLKSVELQKAVVYNLVTPYGAQIQGLHLHTMKGNLVVHPDPLLSDWADFARFVKYISKINIEFVNLKSHEEQVDCNGNTISNPFQDEHERRKQLESSPIKELEATLENGFALKPALHSEDDSMRVSNDGNRSPISMQLDESDGAEVEVCEHFKRESPGGFFHSAEIACDRNTLRVSHTDDNFTVENTDTNFMARMCSDANPAAETPSDVNISTEIASNVKTTSETPPKVNMTAETPSNINITAETPPDVDIKVDKSEVNIKVEISEVVTITENPNNGNLAAEENVPSEEVKSQSIEPSFTHHEARKPFRGRRSTYAKKNFPKVSRTPGLSKNPNADTAAQDDAVEVSPMRRETRSLKRILQEEPQIKTPSKDLKPPKSVNATRKRKRTSEGTALPEILPASTPVRQSADLDGASQHTQQKSSELKNADLHEASHNTQLSSPRLNNMGDSGNFSTVSLEDSDLQVKGLQGNALVPPDDLPLGNPLSMPTLTTPIRDPNEYESQANFNYIHSKLNGEMKPALPYVSVTRSLSDGPPPAVPVYTNSGALLSSQIGFLPDKSAKLRRLDEDSISDDGDSWKNSGFSCETGVMDSSSDASFLDPPSAVLLSPPLTSVGSSLHFDEAKSQNDVTDNMNKLQQFSQIVCSTSPPPK